MPEVLTIESPAAPPSSPPEDAEIIFHERPAVVVRVTGGVARLHAYLSGFDVETTNTSDVRHLARTLVAASEAVDLLNARGSVTYP